jgi:hypothetical protein
MLHDHNTFVRRFKEVMDMPAHDLSQWEVVIRVNGNVDNQRYNVPIAPEMAGLLPGEVLQQCVLLCCLFVEFFQSLPVPCGVLCRRGGGGPGKLRNF